MFYRILFMLLVALACSLPIEVQAACGSGSCGFRPFAGIRARRSAGEGVFQGNGPVRRAVRR